MRKKNLALFETYLAFVILATGCGSQNYFSKEAAKAQQAVTGISQNSTGGALTTMDAAPSGPADVGPSASPSPLIDLSCKDLASCACGPNSIWICHIPPGNPAAAHTICVGIPGALNGHGVTFNGLPGGHGGDYPGHCLGDDTDPSPSPSPSSTSSGV